MRYIVYKKDERYGVVDTETGICKLYSEQDVLAMEDVLGKNTDGIQVFSKPAIKARLRLQGIEYNVDGYLEVGHRYIYKTERHQFKEPYYICRDIDTDRVAKFNLKSMSGSQYYNFINNGISFTNIMSYRSKASNLPSIADEIYLIGDGEGFSLMGLFYMCRLMKAYIRGSDIVPTADNSFFCSSKYDCDARFCDGIVYLTSSVKDYCYAVLIAKDFEITKSQYLPSKEYIAYRY